MSKSRGNTIGMLEAPDSIAARVRTAVTDPQRVRRSDPGRPEVCNVYALHRFFTPASELEAIGQGCRSAALGCVECKRMLGEAVARHFEPMRERAELYRANPDRVYEILGDGAARCRRLAQETLREVRERMGLNASARPVAAHP
jgi:tryptophanyl-tRNA synthetase